MAIRVECDLPAYAGKVWVDFRETGWKFKDRRTILETTSDLVALNMIVGYVEAWQIPDTSFVAGGGIELLDEADDDIVGWLVRAWFEARGKRSGLPKNF